MAKRDPQGGSPSKRGPRPRIVPADGIPRAALDRDALRVIHRLQKHRHEAYFVGGCVRDLWIGRDPKDFDVATSAHPQEIRRLFRNGRIIGRRFRLVHIYYGDHIVETSTFRRDPSPDEDEEDGHRSEDMLIVEDNVFGNAAEDARRRDFTVNGLFLDPAHHEIHDYVDGIRDLQDRVLRTIGDPMVRMAEDPVRILRAVKFATRLDFRIDDATWEAMRHHVGQLSRSAPPRILEEILRLMRSGTAQGAFRMLRACGALEVLLPRLDTFLRGAAGGNSSERVAGVERFWKLLEALDSQVNHGDLRPSTALCVALLFHPLFERERDPEGRLARGPAGEPGRIAYDVVESFAGPTRLSRRDFGRARAILISQDRFLQSASKHFSPLLFARSEEFPEALQLFGLRVDARGQGRDIFQAWEDRQRRARDLADEELDRERRRTHKRRHRRRRRRPSG